MTNATNGTRGRDRDRAVTDRTTRLQELGYRRGLFLFCANGDWPKSPWYFAPPADADIFTAFRDHVERLSRESHAESDPLVVSLLAAGRLLCGDLAAANIILDHLPEQPFQLDHGAGKALIFPVQTLVVALPMPPALKDDCTNRWLAGSAVQAEVRAWLDANRTSLRWDEADGVYRCAE